MELRSSSAKDGLQIGGEKMRRKKDSCQDWSCLLVGN